MNEDLAPGLSKRLTKKSPLNDKYADVAASCLELLVRYFYSEMAAKRYSYSLYLAMILVFKHDTSLHRLSF